MPNLPTTLDEALDPKWLSDVLAPEAGGRRVSGAEVVARVQDTPLKPLIARFKVTYEDGATGAFCLKSIPDTVTNAGPKLVSVREARFFREVAPKITVRVPPVTYAEIDEDRGVGLLIMRDMVEEGAHFCTALEPFDAPRCAATLEQLARLHCAHKVLGPIENITWVTRQLEWLSNIAPVASIQELLNDPRTEGLPAELADAQKLVEALRALARADAERPTCLLHGDSHAGNIFEMPDGPGLVDWQLMQQGGWAIDVAYHIAAVLPADVAEREERALLNHYLQVGRGLGVILPDDETAWLEYRKSFVYGYFLWAITRVVEPPIIKLFFDRLGAALQRHDTYRLLGI